MHTALVALDLTEEERAAVLALLSECPFELDDLISALQRSMQVRRENSQHGGLVIQALHRNGMSWREMANRTGIPQTTLRSWIEPPTERGRRP